MAHYTLLHRPTVSLSASFPNVVPLPLSQGKITGGRGVKSEVWWAVLTGCMVRAQSSSGRSRVWGVKGGSMSFPVAPTCVEFSSSMPFRIGREILHLRVLRGPNVCILDRGVSSFDGHQLCGFPGQG